MKIEDEELSLFKEPDEENEYEEEKMRKKARISRNQFVKCGKYGFPLIKKEDIDLDKIDLMSYTKTKNNDLNNLNKTIHFFTYDWFFENVYDKPEIALEKLGQYYALLSPEFSTYGDMPLARQIDSIFKNRWCGAYWQHHGIKVIPTIMWGSKNSLEFCFDGIEEGCVVAIATYTIEDYKEEFMYGYNIMLEKIKPSAIICYGKPFPEMKGNIKVVDPFKREELIKKIGLTEFTKKYIEGTLYPEI